MSKSERKLKAEPDWILVGFTEKQKIPGIANEKRYRFSAEDLLELRKCMPAKTNIAINFEPLPKKKAIPEKLKGTLDGYDLKLSTDATEEDLVVRILRIIFTKHMPLVRAGYSLAMFFPEDESLALFVSKDGSEFFNTRTSQFRQLFPAFHIGLNHEYKNLFPDKSYCPERGPYSPLYFKHTMELGPFGMFGEFREGYPVYKEQIVGMYHREDIRIKCVVKDVLGLTRVMRVEYGKGSVIFAPQGYFAELPKYLYLDEGTRGKVVIMLEHRKFMIDGDPHPLNKTEIEFLEWFRDNPANEEGLSLREIAKHLNYPRQPAKGKDSERYDYPSQCMPNAHKYVCEKKCKDGIEYYVLRNDVIFVEPSSNRQVTEPTSKQCGAPVGVSPSEFQYWTEDGFLKLQRIKFLD